MLKNVTSIGLHNCAWVMMYCICQKKENLFLWAWVSCSMYFVSRPGLHWRLLGLIHKSVYLSLYYIPFLGSFFQRKKIIFMYFGHLSLLHQVDLFRKSERQKDFIILIITYNIFVFLLTFLCFYFNFASSSNHQNKTWR